MTKKITLLIIFLNFGGYNVFAKKVKTKDNTTKTRTNLKKKKIKPKKNIRPKKKDTNTKKTIEKNIVDKEQKDEKNEQSPTEKIIQEENAKIKKAWISSMLLPGLGQIHNNKIWKTGIIWAGFGGLIGGFIYFHKQYMKINEAGVPTKDVSDRIWRNGLGVAAFFWYALNILDAYVDAHMSSYDISKNLAPDKFPGKEKTNTLIKKHKERKKRKKRMKKEKRNSK